MLLVVCIFAYSCSKIGINFLILIDMNAGLFVFVVLAVIAVLFLIYTETPSGKKWIKNL